MLAINTSGQAATKEGRKTEQENMRTRYPDALMRYRIAAAVHLLRRYGYTLTEPREETRA